MTDVRINSTLSFEQYKQRLIWWLERGKCCETGDCPWCKPIIKIDTSLPVVLEKALLLHKPDTFPLQIQSIFKTTHFTIKYWSWWLWLPHFYLRLHRAHFIVSIRWACIYMSYFRYSPFAKICDGACCKDSA